MTQLCVSQISEVILSGFHVALLFPLCVFIVSLYEDVSTLNEQRIYIGLMVMAQQHRNQIIFQVNSFIDWEVERQRWNRKIEKRED